MRIRTLMMLHLRTMRFGVLSKLTAQKAALRLPVSRPGP
jgi:hypothetical protein